MHPDPVSRTHPETADPRPGVSRGRVRLIRAPLSSVSVGWFLDAQIESPVLKNGRRSGGGDFWAHIQLSWIFNNLCMQI